MQPEGGGRAFERAWCGRKRKLPQNAAFCVKPRQGASGTKWRRSEVRGVYRRSREVDICPRCPRASQDKGKPGRRSQPATSQQAIPVKRRFRRRWTKWTRPTERARPLRLSVLPPYARLASSRRPATAASERTVTRGCASAGRECRLPHGLQVGGHGMSWACTEKGGRWQNAAWSKEPVGTRGNAPYRT